MTELLSPRDFSSVATMSEVVIFNDDILRAAMDGNPQAHDALHLVRMYYSYRRKLFSLFSPDAGMG